MSHWKLGDIGRAVILLRNRISDRKLRLKKCPAEWCPPGKHQVVGPGMVDVRL